MSWKTEDRTARMHGIDKNDQRNDFERDRDRILFSSAFHRLAGVTQIVKSNEEDVFHTRQQHSLKVAQVGRRLAQHLKETCSSKYPSIHIEPEVVEAASLAHDLGHPPFGHVGEETLDSLVKERGNSDGFEGNAQTFRILTKLAIRFEDYDGLNLTRATLAACLKYPWFRDIQDPNKIAKWSAYRSERDDFEFAREFHSSHEHQSIECALMDISDDIAYSVHDLEDFHRCCGIPWEQVFNDETKDEIVNGALKAWHNAPNSAKANLVDAINSFEELIESLFFELYSIYRGTREQRQMLRRLSSTLIGKFLNSVTVINDNGSYRVKLDDGSLSEIKILKQITRKYIISNPSLRALHIPAEGERSIRPNVNTQSGLT